MDASLKSRPVAMDETAGNVLFVDDEKDILASLKRALRSEPYQKHFVLSAKEALLLLKKQSVHVLVSDMRMPHMDGVALLEQVAAKYPDIIRIVISGWADSDSILDAVNSGHIYRYIVKPWDLRELKITLRQALEMFRLQAERKELIRQLKNHNFCLEKEAVQRTEQIMSMNQQAALGKYASQIVENLTEPLNSLSSNIDLIGVMTAGGNIDAHQLQKRVTGAQNSIDQLKSIVSGILDHTQDKKNTQVGLVNINKIIKEEINYFNLNPFFRYEVKKDLKLTPNLPEIMGKSLQVKQILDFLIQNSIDALANVAEKQLTLETIWQQDTILIRSTHNGIGIFQDSCDFNLNKNASEIKEDKTTLLEFSTVKSIVDAYMGKIELNTKAEAGTIIKITLPVGRASLGSFQKPNSYL